jgi:hypothetical protein
MRPLGFLTGVILGSAASIALVLLMVVVVFAFAGTSTVREEYPGLLASAALFGVLAGAAAAAFAGLQRERPWRWAAQALMWLLLAAIAGFFWPAGETPGG